MIISLSKYMKQLTIVTASILGLRTHSFPPYRILILGNNISAFSLHLNCGIITILRFYESTFKIPNENNILNHLSFFIKLISHAVKHHFN